MTLLIGPPKSQDSEKVSEVVLYPYFDLPLSLGTKMRIVNFHCKPRTCVDGAYQVSIISVRKSIDIFHCFFMPKYMSQLSLQSYELALAQNIQLCLFLHTV